MNQAHHEKLSYDLLNNFRLYRGQNLPLVVEDGLRRLWQNRSTFVRYSSAPDRIKDTALHMVWFLPNKTSVAGHNLSSFQHFAVYDRQFKGYVWDGDPSLGFLDKVVDKAVGLLHSHVECRLDAQQDGFAKGILDMSPMATYAMYQGNRKFNEFEFPSAMAVGTYYGDALSHYALSDQDWVQACGFVTHMVCDACVPHHVKGWLFNGHQGFEDEIEKQWTQWHQIKVHTRLPALDKMMLTTVKEVIEQAATETDIWMSKPRNMEQVMKGQPDSAAAIETCSRALDYCIKAVEIMCESRS